MAEAHYKEDTETADKKPGKLCNLCNGEHPLYKCTRFKTVSQHERYKYVKRHILCRLCLYGYHKVEDCRRQFKCHIEGCGLKHSTLLHRKFTQNSAPVQSNAQVKGPASEPAQQSSSFVAGGNGSRACVTKKGLDIKYFTEKILLAQLPYAAKQRYIST